MTNFLNSLKEQTTVGKTQNGAKTYTSTLNANLDFFANAGAMRSNTENVKQLFSKAVSEDKEIALRNLVHLRNIRMGGLGERDAFRKSYEVLVDTGDDTAIKLLKHVAEIGRWDDVVSIYDYAYSTNKKKVVDATVDLIATQLNQDIQDMNAGKPVSLLAKWIPSTSVKSAPRREVAYKLAGSLGLGHNHKEYRKVLAKLRSYLDLVEKKLANKEYYDIEFEKLPSKALFKYRQAFWNHTAEAYGEFLNRVESGEVKMNVSNLLPYEIVRAYTESDWCGGIKEYDRVLEASWSSLGDVIQGSDDNAIVVADTSGSMMGDPWDVAESLAIYAAERMEGAFKNHFITFSTTPKLIQLPANGTLRDKLREYHLHGEISDTDIAAVFNLILRTAIKNNTPQSELPSKIIIISDMEFNQGTRNGNLTNFEVAKNNFENAGYTLPDVVYWNVNSRSQNGEVRFNEQGVALVSGLTPNIFAQVIGAPITSPWEMMMEVLNKPEYSFVTECL